MATHSSVAWCPDHPTIFLCSHIHTTTPTRNSLPHQFGVQHQECISMQLRDPGNKPLTFWFVEGEVARKKVGQKVQLQSAFSSTFYTLQSGLVSVWSLVWLSSWAFALSIKPLSQLFFFKVLHESCYHHHTGHIFSCLLMLVLRLYLNPPAGGASSLAKNNSSTLNHLIMMFHYTYCTSFE